MFGLTSLELQGFYNGNKVLAKSVQPKFKFFVTMLDVSFNAEALIKLQLAGPMPIIQHWHVMNVEIPQYDFKKEFIKYGPIPRSFPIMDFDGFELAIEFEEDDHGTIGNFINWCQRRVITQEGLYNGPEYVKIDRIIVETENMQGCPVSVYTFHNCYLLKASTITYDYAANDSVKYSCIFNADWMDSYFPQKAIKPL